ncbi:MAG: DUF6562 domain-containing protein [Marinifilaceae bacterium]
MRYDKIKNKALYFIICALMLVAAGSCNKHNLCYEHPHTGVSGEVMSVTEFAFDYSPMRGTSTKAPMEVEGVEYRYIIEYWLADEDENVTELYKRIELGNQKIAQGLNKFTVSLKVPATRVRVGAWVEIMELGADVNPHFDAASLLEVKMLSSGSETTKDAFTNCQTLNYTMLTDPNQEYIVQENMALKRPIGRYTIYANDIDSYEQDIPSETNIKYQMWLSTEYNAIAGLLINPRTNVNYSSACDVMEKDGVNCLLLGDDIIMTGVISDEEQVYYAEITTKTGVTTRADLSLGTITMGVSRNTHTEIIQNFLTRDPVQGGGIDDDFEDEITIRPIL